MAIAYSSLPPQIQQALAQHFGIKSPEDAQRLAQRMSDNPQELAAVLQQLGINLSPEDAGAVADEAVDWLDQSAAAQAASPPRTPAEGEEEAEGDPQPDSPAEEEQEAEQEPPVEGGYDADADEGDAAYDTEDGEGEAEPDSAQAAQGEGGSGQVAAARGEDDGDGASDRTSAATERKVQDLLTRAAGGRGVPSIRGGVAGARQRADIDAMITEMISQGQASGGTAPQQGNFKVPRPKMPHSTSTSASNDPRMQKMIADIYRTVANQSSGPERAYTPTGDRS